MAAFRGGSAAAPPAAGGRSATVCGCPASRRRCRTERPGAGRRAAATLAGGRQLHRRSLDTLAGEAQTRAAPRRRQDRRSADRTCRLVTEQRPPPRAPPPARRQHPDSARNRCRPPNGAEREVRAARRRGRLSQRLMACLHACSAVTPSAAVAVTSGTSAAAAKRPAGGVRDPPAGRVPAQRLRASRPSREEVNGSLSATAAARVAANGGELLSALPRPARKPSVCARTVLPARNRPQSRIEAPAERHTTTVGRS